MDFPKPQAWLSEGPVEIKEMMIIELRFNGCRFDEIFYVLCISN
jgi:hypothetical protein